MYFEDAETLNGIIVDELPSEKKVCFICSVATIGAIECEGDQCGRWMHVQCAYTADCRLQISGNTSTVRGTLLLFGRELSIAFALADTAACDLPKLFGSSESRRQVAHIRSAGQGLVDQGLVGQEDNRVARSLEGTSEEGLACLPQPLGCG